MFTTTYQNNHSSTSFLGRNIRRSTTSINAMTNDRSQLPLRTNNLLNPIPPIRKSLLINLNNIKPPITSRSRSNTNENIPLKSSQQHYTYSNPPRELQRKRSLSIRHRVLSAPDETSPRSKLNQPKSSSANGSLKPREDNDNQLIKNNEQEKNSLNALIKEQQKSNVPKSVQKRRIILLFPPSTPKQEPNPSPISPDYQQIPLQNNQNSHPQDLFDNNEPEMADTMQLAAILASIQLENDFNSNETSSKQQQQTSFDPSKYEYVVANPSDTATYKLSPRTLKPTEDLAARLRFSQYYRSEMRLSANAQIPPLMGSIVTENNSTIGNGIDIEQTLTFKLNPTDTINKQNSFDENVVMQKTIDNELVHIYYDATLKRFYDPNTGKYYELTSE